MSYHVESQMKLAIPKLQNKYYLILSNELDNYNSCNVQIKEGGFI